MKSLKEQVVLITGAGGGFGRALTRLLLREGCLLILSDVQRASLLESATAAAQTAKEAPGRVLGFVEADLSQATGATRLYADVTRISSRIDILVNNAGIAVYGRFDQIPRDHWERLMEINLLAPMRLTHLFLPQMIARRSGHIVNISSAAGLVGVAGMSVYNASKFGLRGFTEALAGDLAPLGIDVTGIYPFFTRTAILDSPHFGRRPWRLPGVVVGDPEVVMARLVRALRRRERHVYPGFWARATDVLRRVRA
ncbi:MAG: SDR family oxidoreductase [Oscillochloridaceae bacterium]|nr:SDR family oxidoreductase [Chloroflexaceae bacterium]MDW8391595.1 SDR family oxidoreductase [Oscillochloridaceae bacterium]